MRWLTIFILFGVSIARAQESSPEPTLDSESQSQEQSETVVESTSTVIEGTESDAGIAEDLSPAETDSPLGEGLPEAPTDDNPLTAEDIIPMAPMPEFSLPDEALVDPGADFLDDLPPAPPPPAVAIESATEKMRADTIRYREVRVQAEKDPQVVQMAERVDQEKTLEGRRAALREYYRLLFARVVEIDSSLKIHAENMELAYIRRLAQVRLEPTIPLEPPPTPEPLD